jgi:hypothetical protein
MVQEALAVCAATEAVEGSMARRRKTTRVSSGIDYFVKATAIVDVVVVAYEFAYFYALKKNPSVSVNIPQIRIQNQISMT